MSGLVRANFNIDCSVLSYAELEAFKKACQLVQQSWNTSEFKITQNELLVKELGPGAKTISPIRQSLMFN
jgi:hypothetical protein